MQTPHHCVLNPLQAALACAILGGGCWVLAVLLVGRLVGAW